MSRHFAWLLLLLPLIALSPSYAQADEPVRPDTTDPDAYPPPATRLRLVLGGLGMTTLWYGAAAGMSLAFPDAPGANDLRIPVAGPWMALADSGCSEQEPNCSTFSVVLRAVLTFIDGVGQAGGLLIATEALFLPTQAIQPVEPASPQLSLQPLSIAGEGLGLSFQGHF